MGFNVYYNPTLRTPLRTYLKKCGMVLVEIGAMDKLRSFLIELDDLIEDHEKLHYRAEDLRNRFNVYIEKKREAKKRRRKNVRNNTLTAGRHKITHCSGNWSSVQSRRKGRKAAHPREDKA